MTTATTAWHRYTIKDRRRSTASHGSCIWTSISTASATTDGNCLRTWRYCYIIISVKSTGTTTATLPLAATTASTKDDDFTSG
tara:strand:+ start:279 stop:527 length:249 start_codon:yes stop_codon:yes gene_type:complete